MDASPNRNQKPGYSGAQKLLGLAWFALVLMAHLATSTNISAQIQQNIPYYLHLLASGVFVVLALHLGEPRKWMALLPLYSALYHGYFFVFQLMEFLFIRINSLPSILGSFLGMAIYFELAAWAAGQKAVRAREAYGLALFRALLIPLSNYAVYLSFTYSAGQGADDFLPRLLLNSLPNVLLFLMLAWFGWAVNRKTALPNAARLLPPLPPDEKAANRKYKSRNIAAILAFLLGGLSAHNFYLGYPGKALLQILLGPGFAGAAYYLGLKRILARDFASGLNIAILLYVVAGLTALWVLMDLIHILASSLEPRKGPYRENTKRARQIQLYNEQRKEKGGRSLD